MEDRIIEVKWATNANLPKVVLIPGFITNYEIPGYLWEIYGQYIKSFKNK